MDDSFEDGKKGKKEDKGKDEQVSKKFCWQKEITVRVPVEC